MKFYHKTSLENKYEPRASSFSLSHTPSKAKNEAQELSTHLPSTRFPLCLFSFLT